MDITAGIESLFAYVTDPPDKLTRLGEELAYFADDNVDFSVELIPVVRIPHRTEESDRFAERLRALNVRYVFLDALDDDAEDEGYDLP
jgi:hypothetical protein